MGAEAAVSIPVHRMSTAVSPPDHHHPTMVGKERGQLWIAWARRMGNISYGFSIPV